MRIASMVCKSSLVHSSDYMAWCCHCNFLLWALLTSGWPALLPARCLPREAADRDSCSCQKFTWQKHPFNPVSVRQLPAGALARGHLSTSALGASQVGMG